MATTLVIEFENKGKTYTVSRSTETSYILAVDGVLEPNVRMADEIFRRLGWLLHDDSVTLPLLKELEI